MDILTPLILSTILTGSDYKTTQYFHDRYAYVRDTSFISNNKVRAGVQFSSIIAGDLIVQKRDPKHKWHYRVLVTAITAAAVGNNLIKRK